MKLSRIFAAVALAPLVLAAGPAPRQANWISVVAPTPQAGYRVGNPAATAKLVEYVSYTCPHCAHFEAEAADQVMLTFVAGGKGSVEYRPFIRNKVDLAVTLMVTCGPASKFRGNHSAILRGQEKWFHGPSAGEEQRWESGDFGTAMRAIAGDLKLYDLFQARGYTRAELDRCLLNRPAADKLAAQTQYAVNDLGVNGTPSFILNGALLPAHDWNGLRGPLAAASR